MPNVSKGQILCNSISPGVKLPSSARLGESSHLTWRTKSGGISVPYTDFGPARLLSSLWCLHKRFWHFPLESLHTPGVDPRPAGLVHITRELVRNASLQASLQTCWIRTCSHPRSPGGSCAWIRLECLSLTFSLGQQFGFSCLHLAGSVTTLLLSIF